MDPRRAAVGRHLAIDHDAVYGQRFADDERPRRLATWREIARFLQRFVPPDAVVLELAADQGLFSSNIRARERWATDIRDTSSYMPAEVKFVQSDGLALREVLPLAHFDRVFISNYLEHLPSSEAVVEQLRIVHDLLVPGGQAIILQPNIRLTGAAYWDFIDHKTALTERSLTEAARMAGLSPVRTIVHFLPYTTRSRLPQSAWLVRAYLAFPLAWRLLGKQTLFIAERSA